MKARNLIKPLIFILLASLMMLVIAGCSSSSHKQDTQDTSSQTQETGSSAEDNSPDSELIASFVNDFNDSAQRKLESTNPIVLDDERANSIANQFFSSAFKGSDSDGMHCIYSYPKNDADSLHPINYLGISVEDASGTKTMTVCGMFGKNEQMVDAFHSAFLLLSKDATQADFDQLEKDETFLYGGKSGEISDIQYEVGVFGGYHTISLTAPVSNLNIQEI